MRDLDLNPPPGIHPELGTLVGALEDSTNEWRENLELPSTLAITWSPYENGSSIGGAILHMIAAERY